MNNKTIQQHIREARVEQSVALGNLIAASIMSVINFGKTSTGKLTVAVVFILIGSGYALTHSFNNVSVPTSVKYPLFAVR